LPLPRAVDPTQNGRNARCFWAASRHIQEQSIQPHLAAG